MTDTNSFACADCEVKGQRPCAPKGEFDTAWVAQSYLEMINANDTTDPAKDISWAYNCLDNLHMDNPELAFRIILMMAGTLTSQMQASMVAAGPLEDLIANKGCVFIDRIEALARQSKRFRYILSGVWSQGRSNTPDWKRIAALQATGPHIDRDETMPPSDIPA
ncbi:hypothetical protein MNBD_ALPHA07-1799 [hydrothermal vent metagenome]|uniref:DUF6869 domain-containing protein n=1 Tax=hydrothermal vent metagenome TaxID=652676 RepID=A0A3B0RWS6_9ZZZZ